MLLMCVFYRADCEHVENVVDPFDWTFTTDYCGTILGHDGNSLQVCHLHQTVALKVICNDLFLVVKVNCLSSVFNIIKSI